MADAFWDQANDEGIEVGEEFRSALEAISGPEQVVFITGKAGTGKSTLLKYVRDNLKKNIAVVAFTGVAAVNVKGQTIHSFFGFHPQTTRDSIVRDQRRADAMKHLDVLFIDEISMVRADLMDWIDTALRKNRSGKTKLPFGGVKIVCFGDLYQLPPIVKSGEEEQYFKEVYASPFFFDAEVFQSVAIKVLELSKSYRQDQETQADFLSILNCIREGEIGDELLALLNSRVITAGTKLPDNVVTLSARREAAALINQLALEQLDGTEYILPGLVSGGFHGKDLPTEEVLRVKEKAQIMMLNNDASKRWVNGDVATVVRIKINKEAKTEEIIIRLTDTGALYPVAKHSWENVKFSFNSFSQSMEPEVAGQFTQYPFCLAWAVTIHKAQGKTFENICIELGRGAFAAGQTYVALSRARTLEGLYLKQPVTRRDLMIDKRIHTFFENINNGIFKKEDAVRRELF
jgi:ATP-dependent DNA helicase PIF1